jgi:multiple sugar transport system substrate-binding protein
VKNKVDWALVPTEDPKNPRGGVWIGRVLSISSQSQHPDKAWQVISYITSKKVSKNAVISKSTINDPFRKSHFTSTGKGAFPTKELNQHFLSTVQASLENPNADLMIPGGWEYMQALDQNIYLALIHKTTAEAALKNTADEWNKITENYGRPQQSEYYKQWLNLLEGVRTNEMAQ